MFSLESVVGPVHTCLVLVMFPVFRCLLYILLTWLLWIFATEDRMFQSTRSILYHFYTAVSDLHQVDMDLLPQMIVKFWPPPKRICFQPRFSKTSGRKHQQHLPLTSASAHMWFAKHWFQEQLSRAWRSRKFYTKSQLLWMYKCF